MPKRKVRKWKMFERIGYIIVMDGLAVRHQDSDPYWLQWSRYCELYPTYDSARTDVRREIRKLNAMLNITHNGRGVSTNRLLQWRDNLRIIPVHRAPVTELKRKERR